MNVVAVLIVFVRSKYYISKVIVIRANVIRLHNQYEERNCTDYCR